MNQTLQPVPNPVFSLGPDTAAQGGESKERLSIAYYWNVLRRYKWALVLFVLLGAAIGYWRFLTATPIYRAQLTMIIEPERANLTTDAPLLNYYTFSRFFETQYEIIRSRNVAERVVERLSLTSQTATPAESTSDTLPGIGMRVRSMWATAKAAVLDAIDEYAPGVRRRVPSTIERASPDLEQQSNLSRQVQAGISVTGSDNSQLVTLAFNSPDPQYAADVVNAVAEEYIGLGVQTRRDRTQQAELWLSNQLEELRTRVVESQAELKGFQTREGLIDLSSLKELTGSRLATLDQAVVEAQAQYNELSKRYGPKHPKLIAAAAEFAETQERLTIAQRSSVDTQGQSFELARLEQEVVTNRELYELFLARLNESDMSQDESSTSARILDPAQVPRVPFEPKMQKILGIWTLFGLLTAVLFVFLKEQLDNTLKSPSDAEELLGLPVLGVLPLVTDAKRRKKGELKPERYYLAGTGSPFVESINHVRTGVVFSDVDHPPKALLITSAIQGEGKTTLATNLALAFAQLGKTVLVDADLRKPRASQVAGLADGLGIVDFAAGRCELADCLSVDSESEELAILRSGSIPPNPLELISSNRFASVVGSLKDQFSYIIIDAPPVLPVSDAVVLSRLADAVILLVETERTTKTTVREAKDRLVKSNVKPLGLVLSKFNARKQMHYYGKHSYYYYNNYYTQKDGHRSKRAASA